MHYLFCPSFIVYITIFHLSIYTHIYLLILLFIFPSYKIVRLVIQYLSEEMPFWYEAM